MIQAREISDIQNESDAEQKFVLQLITQPVPLGLGYLFSDFRTKPNLKKLAINKGKEKKSFYPDYLIITDGIPSIVIEVKKPNEELKEAYREARLYSHEINACFPIDINPCRWVIATNSNELWFGHYDSEAPKFKISLANLNTTDENYTTIINTISKEAIVSYTTTIRKKFRKDSVFLKPKNLLGGRAVANETIGENSFGASVSLEYRHLFNPTTLEEREDVVKNAYVSSKKRDSHITPIEKIIKQSVAPVAQQSISINETTNPTELNTAVEKYLPKLKKELCLLIGARGSGKSTFTDFLRVKGLSTSLRNKTAWININLNDAPIASQEIYSWVIKQLIAMIRASHPDIDFDSLEVIKQIFATEIKTLEKGPVSIFSKDSEKYQTALYESLVKLTDDKSQYLKAIINFCYDKKSKTLIVVLDNCDKRERAEQLLMFEVANWLKNEFNCVIFLPLRDSTYDNFSKEPPLDTVVKDLIFRIDPPLLEKVVYARLNYVLREIGAQGGTFSFTAANSSTITCDRKDIGKYLQAIAASLFQDPFFKRVIAGIGGKNIREGLELVINVCKSGFISPDDIVRIFHSNIVKPLPHHLVSNILIRNKNKYYSDQQAIIKNLFNSDKGDALPDPFIRLQILVWLRNKHSDYGPNRTRGYHKLSTLLAFMQANGHSTERSMIEVQTLVNSGCILAESFTHKIQEEDLICLSSSGFVHLDLIKDVNYLSAIAEDTFYRDSDLAQKIAGYMASNHKVYGHLTRNATLATSNLLIKYLYDYQKNYFITSNKYVEYDDEFPFDLKVLNDFMDSKVSYSHSAMKEVKLPQSFPKGTVVQGIVTKATATGFIVTFGENQGFTKHYNKRFKQNKKSIKVGESASFIVEGFNSLHRRFSLKMI